MNIVEMLIEDHERLRSGLAHVRQCLYRPGSGCQLEEFIRNFEQHESVENHILFPELDFPAGPDSPGLAEYEGEHHLIWGKLQQLREALDAGDLHELQTAFFDFHAIAEEHMRNEERRLFPAVRGFLNPDLLDLLGRKAQAQFPNLLAHRQLA